MLLAHCSSMYLVWRRIFCARAVYALCYCQAKIHCTPFEQLAVEFENVHIHQATLLPDDGSVTLRVFIHPGSGRFELSDNTENVIVTGRVSLASQPVLKLSTFLSKSEDYTNSGSSQESGFDLDLQTKDVYQELRLRGYDYGPAFQVIKDVDQDGREKYMILHAKI